MTREEKVKAFEMSLDGATFQEIADAFGVSRQCIEQGLTRKIWRAPKKFECVFPVLKRWLDEQRLSISRFNKAAKVCKYSDSLRRKLAGDHAFTMHEIKAILAYTGLTFEEAFGVVEDAPGGDTNGSEQQAEGGAI